MKKLLALTLVLFLLPAVAFSEDVTDLEAFFESCTFEELSNLNRVVQLYLVKKSLNGGNGVLIEPGTYEVGVDIPAGSYYFVGVEGRYPSSVHVYPSIEKTHAIDAIQTCYNFGYGSNCDSTKTGKFILQYGWIVQVVQGPAVIYAYTGLFN